MSQLFATWLSQLFRQSEHQVNRLLEDESALHFLITWSLFESKCFEGFLKAESIAAYAKKESATLNLSDIRGIGAHFHERYQNSRLFQNLMHKQKNERLLSLLKESYADFTPEDVIFFLTFIIYRYRNNIFHGNKGVESWLQYREQIQLCIQAMQVMISHAEQVTPTMIAETVSSEAL